MLRDQCEILPIWSDTIWYCLLWLRLIRIYRSSKRVALVQDRTRFIYAATTHLEAWLHEPIPSYFPLRWAPQDYTVGIASESSILSRWLGHSGVLLLMWSQHGLRSKPQADEWTSSPSKPAPHRSLVSVHHRRYWRNSGTAAQALNRIWGSDRLIFISSWSHFLALRICVPR